MFSVLLAFVLALSYLPPAAIAAQLDDLTTTGNEDIMSASGEALQDETYQYGIAGDDYFAYLWVPQTAAHLNGVLVAKSNLIEVRLLESKTVRNTLAKYHIGVVYIHARSTTDKPSNANIMGDFVYVDDDAIAQYNSGYAKPANAGSTLDEIMARFAAVSGYDELLYAPFIGVGHSAGMGLGRALGAWYPDRTIAQICLKGGTQLTIPGITGRTYAGDNYDTQPGVPLYLAAGQFTEHAGYDNPAGKDNYIDGEIKNVTKLREKGSDRLVTMSVEWETGHYDWSEKANEAVANYLDSIIPARLGAQASSPDKLARDFVLEDLTQTGYLAEPAMFGTRTTQPAESEYRHGTYAECVANGYDLSKMIWFPNQNNYNFVKSFTTERKDIAGEAANQSIIPVSYDRSYQTSTGAFSEWPSGNICFYVGDTQAIAMKFDISGLRGTDVGSVTFAAPMKSGNTARAITLSQIENPWDAQMSFTVPTSRTVIAENLPAPEVSYDVTSIIQAALNENKTELYLQLSSTDGGSGSDYYCTTAYEGYTNGSLTTDTALLPHLQIDSGSGINPTKHQYLKLEDPNSETPRDYTRITRYDAINPNNKSYAAGIAGDPMTFSMVVDKMGVVTEDHLNKGDRVNTSDTPAYLVPAMAPLEWVGVKQESLTDSDKANNVASKWRNYMRWKNNRVAYRMAAQDSYVNLNTADVYVGDELKFAKATNTFQIYNIAAQTGEAQHIQFADIPNQTVSGLRSGIVITPTTEKAADGYYVDVMVEYGPVKAVRNGGSYTVTLDQLPAGASYPIEVKLVATQFGSTANKVQSAEPVEKIFYITEDTDNSAYMTNGKLNANKLKMDGITGFTVTGTGTISLDMADDTSWNARAAADVSAARANAENAYTKKHYQYPAGYQPYDHWADRGAWTATAAEGTTFVPLSAFTKTITQPDGNALVKENINLDYINEISWDGTISAVTPVAAQTEVNDPVARKWGNGVSLVWQKAPKGAYDFVKVYADGAVKAESTGTTALVSGLDAGTEYTFTIKTVKGGTESDGVTVRCTPDGKTYMVEDFECADLTSGTNLISSANTQPVYAWSSYMGETLLLKENGDNRYLAMQNTYTNWIQTVPIHIPGGLTADMKRLMLDIKVDKLENTQPGGQVYFELCNPTTGKSYGIERGTDFALDDTSWHNGYNIDLAMFQLPSSPDELRDITVLKIGRKVVGGGNNNRRAKMYLDNVAFSAEEANPVHKIDLSEARVMTGSGYPTGATVDMQTVGKLFNGDTSDSYTQNRAKRMFIDLGQELAIRRIVLYDNKTLGTLCVWSSNTSPAALNNFDYHADTNPNGFKQILRTNGSTNNGVASSYVELEKDGAVYGKKATAFEVSAAVGNIRYLSLGDWSNAADIAEIEVYVDAIQYPVNAVNTARTTIDVPSKAYPGDSVRVSVTPAEGVAVSGLSITDVTGAAVAYTANTDGTYTFIMPAKEVTVAAKSKSTIEFATKATFTGMPDTSLTANGVQIDANGKHNLMLGRGRISLIKLDLSDVDGVIDNAALNLTRRAGANHSVAIFYMPNNGWTEDVTKGNDITFDGTTKLTAFQGVSLYTTDGRKAVFPDLAAAASGNDTDPGNEGQDMVAQSAKNGILKEFFYGDIIKSGTAEADISNTVKAAIAANPTASEITLLLYTPYTFASTLDFYSKDYADVKDNQKPSWTVNKTTPVPEPEFSFAFDKPVKTENGICIPVTVTGSGSQNAVIYVAEYRGDALAAVRTVQRETIEQSKNIDIACSFGTDTRIEIFVWDEKQNPLSRVLTFE